MIEEFTTRFSEIIDQWVTDVVQILPLIVIGIIIFFLSLVIAKRLAKFVDKTLHIRGTDQESIILLSRIVRWTIISFGILLAFQQAGMDISAFLTGLGVLGFTIGFALQEVSSNFIAGILLLWQQPFDLGDTIEINGYIGVVREINLRDTEILSVDGLSIRIPNNKVFSNPIKNFTQVDRRRIELPVGVSYDSDLEKVQQLTVQSLKQVQGILPDPAPRLVFHEFGGTTINGTIYCWVDTGAVDFLNAKDSVLQKINQTYTEAGIEMPFPTQKLIFTDQDGSTSP